MGDQPTANIPVFGPQMLALLSGLSEIRNKPPLQRIAVIQELDSGVRLILERIQTRLLSEREGTAELARLAGRMGRIVANAYDEAIQDIMRTPNPLTRRKVPPTTIALLNQLRQEQLCAALAYRPLDNGFWEVVNRILRQALKAGRKHKDIRSLCAAIIVFALLDPRRLTTQQIKHIADLSALWPFGAVQFTDEKNVAPGFFLAEGNDPPGSGIGGQGCLHIHLVHLDTYLREQVQRNNINEAMVSRLLMPYSPKEDRVSPRRGERAITGITGVASINQYLSADTASASPDTVLRDTNVVQWRKAPIVTHAMTLMDVSSGGCRFCLSDSAATLTVGQPIFVQWRPGDTRIGIIVWNERHRGQHHYGMEWALRSPRSVQIESGQHQFPGLLGQCMHSPVEALLYETPSTRSPSRCVVVDGNRQRHANVTVFRNTGTLKMLHVEWTETPVHPHSPEDVPTQTQDFDDDIWLQLAGNSSTAMA